jgi:hypothetical protein
MISISDLPPTYDPGRFFILYPGLYITLANFATMHFSGLRTHGGTAPVAPPGADPVELQSAVRFNIIYYPPKGQLLGNQRYALGGLPNHSTFFVAPEMTAAESMLLFFWQKPILIETDRPLDREQRGWCPHATYLEDGRVIAAQRSHVNFIVRALYCVVLYFILQLPEEYGVRVDLDTFFLAFSMLNEDNQRTRIQPWVAGPGYRYNAKQPSTDMEVDDMGPTTGSHDVLNEEEFKNQEDVRAPMRATWARYYQHVASHIPYAVCKATPEVELNDDGVGVESTAPGGDNGKGKSRQQHQGGRPSSTWAGPGNQGESCSLHCHICHRLNIPPDLAGKPTKRPRIDKPKGPGPQTDQREYDVLLFFFFLQVPPFTFTRQNPSGC